MNKRWFDRDGLAEFLTLLFVGAGMSYQLITYLGPLGIFIIIAVVGSTVEAAFKKRS